MPPTPKHPPFARDHAQGKLSARRTCLLLDLGWIKCGPRPRQGPECVRVPICEDERRLHVSGEVQVVSKWHQFSCCPPAYTRRFHILLLDGHCGQKSCTHETTACGAAYHLYRACRRAGSKAASSVIVLLASTAPTLATACCGLLWPAAACCLLLGCCCAHAQWCCFMPKPSPSPAPRCTSCSTPDGQSGDCDTAAHCYSALRSSPLRAASGGCSSTSGCKTKTKCCVDPCLQCQPSPGLTLADCTARCALRTAGFRFSSSGHCVETSRKTCTSFEGLRQESLDGAVALRRASGCGITITGRSVPRWDASCKRRMWCGAQLPCASLNK
jgi:hypothetical protein